MRKLFKLAGIWIVLFSFSAQTTGAASLAMLGSPMAARNMMPPPSQQALQAIPLKTLPVAVPVKSAPGPTKLDPKVQVPAEWGYYVLASAELAYESAASALSSFKNGIGSAAESWTYFKKGLTSETLAAPEPLAKVDLAAPVPAEEPAAVDLEAVPEPAQQSMQVVRESIPVSHAGMLANPVRAVAVAEPETAAPEVINHAMPARVDETLQGEAAERALAKPVNDARNVVRFPHLHPARKFAIRMPGLDQRRIRAARSGVSRMEGAWNEGRGIRFRIVYLNPVGFSQADGHGFQYNLPGKLMQNPAEVVPQQYWGTYAVYNHGQEVSYEVEIQNTGRSPIRNLTVVAAQEVFSREGGAGRRLPTQAGRTNVPVVEPGQTVKLRNRFRITSDWAWHGSLEQTHVLVTGATAGAKVSTLAEAYQAGIIDPPPDI